ncbi:hypothetical protein Plhal703r1_c10g0051701 [Plasmopara halstedii]
MRGAFYVATAFLIASSTRTAAESVQIKSEITQDLDKLPVGDSDTKSLPRRSLKGSGDRLEIPVAEEERVIPTGVLEGAGKDVSEAILRLEKSGDDLKMVKVGEGVGSSATSKGKRIQIFQKSHKDAVAEHQQVFDTYKHAIKKNEALELERDTALIKSHNWKLLSDYFSAQAAKDTKNYHNYHTIFSQLDSVVTPATASYKGIKNTREKYLALLEESFSRANAAKHAGNMDEYNEIQVTVAEL